MGKKVKVVINPDYQALEPVINALANQGMPDDAAAVYENRRNHIKKILRQGQWLNIKAFKLPNTMNSLVYGRLHKSKAQRSYQHAMEIMRHGLSTPAPIAYIEIYEGARLKESYYVSKHVDGDEMRFWERRPDSEALLAAFAKDMLRLHQAGIYHKDFSPGNIIVTGDKDKGYEFYYVDLNRMRIGCHSFSKMMRNFRCINGDKSETIRLARLYAKAANKEIDEVVDAASRAYDAYHRSKARHRFFKKMIGK